MAASEIRPLPDDVLVRIADYVKGYEVKDADAFRVARYSVLDAIGCALEALSFSGCTALLGPVVPGALCPGGARVLGTRFELDPVRAAFNLTTMMRWLDFNDGLTTDQGGHPSDNLGGILAIADYLSRLRRVGGKSPLMMRDVLSALIKTYEIQGVLSLENNFVRVGYDYVILPKVALTAVATSLLGGNRDDIINAVSNAWADGVSLTIYRQGKNAGSRMCWAGGDAAARAVQLALMATKGEMGYPSVLTERTYGFQDAFFKGKELKVPRPYGEYVINHILMFKFIPAGVQAQTAGECAIILHPLVKDRLDDIGKITVRGHERMIRVLDKKGPLSNPADRTHCVQYVVAVLLIHGQITPSDFSDQFAADPRIDRLREKIIVAEEPSYTRDFNDPAKRSNTQSIQVCFKDGTTTPNVEIQYAAGYPPLGPKAFSLVDAKFRAHLAHRYSQRQQDSILVFCSDQAIFEQTPVDVLVEQFATPTRLEN